MARNRVATALLALVVLGGAACSKDDDSPGRVAVAEITCGQGVPDMDPDRGDEFCEGKMQEAIDGACQQDDVATVRLTVFRSAPEYADEPRNPNAAETPSMVDDIDRPQVGTRIVSQETSETACDK